MLVDVSRSLQDQFAPHSICFGCGPANQQGLRIKSFVATSKTADEGTDSARRFLEPNPTSGKLIATFTPQPHHVAFEGIVNGGIISTLLDCHLNWTAAWHLMLTDGLDVPPCCVTARYEVTFKAPTPFRAPLRIEAAVIESSSRKAVVGGILGPFDLSDPARPSINEVTATGLGTFVAVKPDHPAYHRW
jgi:acyl-coenzyme A thioesterase PaaI-like protein